MAMYYAFFKRTVLAFVLVASCGTADPESTRPEPTWDNSCSTVYGACEQDAAYAGSVFAYYGRLYVCGVDLGNCFATETSSVSCHDRCQIALAHVACADECYYHGGEE